MILGGVEYCDLCGKVIFPDDGTAIKLKQKERTLHLNFHNRAPDDCLDKELSTLKQRDLAAQN